MFLFPWWGKNCIHKGVPAVYKNMFTILRLTWAKHPRVANNLISSLIIMPDKFNVGEKKERLKGKKMGLRDARTAGARKCPAWCFSFQLVLAAARPTGQELPIITLEWYSHLGIRRTAFFALALSTEPRSTNCLAHSRQLQNRQRDVLSESCSLFVCA